jgi:IS5 family transposase
VKIYHPGLRRGITQGLRAMIRRRSAIEPALSHMKADGKLARNWLKGALGDGMNAVLSGIGHNLRMILRKLRHFYAPCSDRFAQPLDGSTARRLLSSRHNSQRRTKRIIQARLIKTHAESQPGRKADLHHSPELE